MSRIVECVACGGTDQTEDERGREHYHVCPPEEVLTLRDRTGAETVKLRPECAGLVVADSQADADAAIAAGAPADAIRVVVARALRRRPGHRDENTLRREGDGGKIRVLVSEGAGTRPRPDLDRAPGR